MLLLDAKTEDLIILMIIIWMRFGRCAGMYTRPLMVIVIRRNGQHSRMAVVQRIVRGMR